MTFTSVKSSGRTVCRLSNKRLSCIAPTLATLHLYATSDCAREKDSADGEVMMMPDAWCGPVQTRRVMRVQKLLWLAVAGSMMLLGGCGGLGGSSSTGVGSTGGGPTGGGQTPPPSVM